MNVYIVGLARELAAAGVEVDIFTRATSAERPALVQTTPGVTIRTIAAGGYRPLAKTRLAGQLHAFTSGVLRAVATRTPTRYDLVHSHYWLSGQVGRTVTERWGLPLVHSMHTMAKVKNRALAAGDRPEPAARELGEQQVVTASNRLVANSSDEALQLVELYGADPSKVATVWPGVDLTVFTPGSRAAARAHLGLGSADVVLLFAGRIQPLKAPDVLIHTVARLLAAEPCLRSRIVVPIVGGLSGTGTEHPNELAGLAHSLGVDDVVRFCPPVDQTTLADWYRAADLTVVPSYSESFGLVALESQACGTPVVASAVGGLPTAVHDGWSGALVNGHDPADWARVIAALMDDPPLMQRLRHGAIEHASGFGWDVTAKRLLEVYADVSERLPVGAGKAVWCR